MIRQLKGKIFLADERGISQAGWFHSRNVFNFGSYYNENKKQFGPLYVLNDEELAGSASISMLIEEDSFVILLPVAGAIAIKDSNGKADLIAAGQARLINATTG